MSGPESSDRLKAGDESGRRPVSGGRFRWGKVRVWFLAVMVVVVVGVAGLGWTYYRAERLQVMAEAAKDLVSVADLKSQGVGLWLDERRKDLLVASRLPGLNGRIGRFLEEPYGNPPTSDFSRSLEIIRDAYTYQSVALYDGRGRLRFSIPGGFSEVPEYGSNLVRVVQESDGVSVLDLHGSMERGSDHVDFVVQAGESGAKLGVSGRAGLLLFRADPKLFLFTLADWRSGVHRTAETVVFRRDGDRWVFVTRPRHPVGTEVARRFMDPSDRGNLVSFFQRGEVGRVEGLDYRGVPVLAEIRRIEKTPWVMVTKVDLDDVLRPFEERVMLEAVAVLATLLALAVVVRLVWQDQSAALQRSKEEAEARSRAQEQRLGALMLHANAIILVLDENQRVLDCNQQAMTAYGYTLEEFQALRPEELSAPGVGLPGVEVQESFASAEGALYESVHRRKDGTLFPVEIRGRLVSREGRMEVLVVIHDITQRKAMEREIARISRLHGALGEINLAIVHSKTRGELFDRVCRILVEVGEFRMAWISRYNPETSLLHPVSSHGDDHGFLERASVYGDDRPEGGGPSGRAFRTGEPCVCNDFDRAPMMGPWREETARVGLVSSCAIPIRCGAEPFGVLSVYSGERDVFQEKEVGLLRDAGAELSYALNNLAVEEERRLADQALKERLEIQAAVFGQAADAMALVDPETGAFVEFNEAAHSMLGYTREAYARLRVMDIDVQYAPGQIQAEFHRMAQPEGAVVETRHRHVNGSVLVVRVSSRAVTIRGRTLLVSVWGDITKGKRAEAQLVLQGAALNAAANGIVITDASGSVVWVNKAYTVMTGYGLEEAAGQLLFPQTEGSGDHPAEFFEDMWATLRAGDIWRGEVKRRRKDGGGYLEAVVVTPVRDSGGSVSNYIAILEDVTERRELQEQYLRAQRMESVGMLAGGIAHDLNNILAPILLAMPLFRDKSVPESLQPVVDTLEQSASRGAAIIRQVLTFARGAKGEMGVVQVRHLVKEMVRMARETFPRNILFRVIHPSDLWPVRADATQLNQVLMNLSVNARDAMPNGGTMTFTMENVELGPEWVPGHEKVEPGPFLRLTVRDTGVGMSGEVLGRVFEPFFTTKEIGKGTGLGLSTVLGIVRGHGGFVQVESSPGHGTAFHLHFPALPGEVHDGEDAAAGGAMRGRGEWLLLVDDEISVLTIAQSILVRHGYHVLTAVDGAEALTVFEANAGRIALVMTDYMMPGMDGIALVQRLRGLKPGIPCVLMSGLMGAQDAARREQLRGLGIVRVLTKPFASEALLEAAAVGLTEQGRG